MTKRFKYTPDPTKGDKPLELIANEVFVFGANQLGKHFGGSALAATQMYGAQMSEIHRTGYAYGIVTVFFPTSTTPLTAQPKMTKEELEKEFELFIKQTELEPEKVFYLTRVGTQRAAWTLREILDAFHKYYNPMKNTNIVLPGDEWEHPAYVKKSWEV